MVLFTGSLLNHIAWQRWKLATTLARLYRENIIMKVVIKLISIASISTLSLLLSIGLLTALTASANTNRDNPLTLTHPPDLPLKAVSSSADAFGYTYQDETELFGPSSVFTDISGSGTPLTLADDGASDITLPFTFEFYGTTDNELRVGNNGAIIFNPTGFEKILDNACPFASATNVDLIAPWWDDWDASGTVYWEVFGSAPNRYAVIQWDQMVHFVPYPSSSPVTFEAVLFETSNLILFLYDDTDANNALLDNGNNGTIGIRGINAANTLQYETCNGGDVLTDTRAIRFQRSSLTIIKDAIPYDDAQSFTFNGTGLISNTFYLDDNTDPTYPISYTFFVPPGSYTVTETTLIDWDLSNLTCDDPAAVPNLVGLAGVEATLSPTSNITCIFTNTKRSRLTVDKVTAPSGDPTSFDFGLSGGPDAISTTFSLTDTTTPYDSGLIKPGSYTLTETAIAGWTLTAATCSNGSTPLTDTITLAPGEIVNCTFTNTENAQVIVDKITDPTSDPTLFDFTLSGSPSAISNTFSLADTTTPETNSDLEPGIYTLTETIPTGWELSTALCSNGVDPSLTNLTLVAGDIVTCRFTNTQLAQITVDKVTTPTADITDFDFSITGGTVNQTFALSDTATPHNSGYIQPGSYTVTETQLFGWSLNATCDNGNDPTTGDITLSTGDNVTCVFTNTAQPGQVIVDKITDPTADLTEFDFSLSGGPDTINQTFTLSDTTTPYDSGTIKPGSYTLTETQITDWDLTALCDNGDDPTTGDIYVDAAQTVTCPFTNTERGRIIVDKVTSPTADLTDFYFALSGGPDTINQIFPLSDTTTLYDSGTLKPGSYSLTETPLTGWDVTASCTNGDDPTAGNVTLDAGETITCTFTNTAQPGQIIVDKVTDPGGDSTSFDFALSGGPDTISQTFALLDTTTPYTSGLINPGSYSLTETQLSGWDLTALCDNGDDPTSGNITLDAAETLTCIFTNTQRGQFTVDKITDPSGSATSFDFNLSGGPDSINQAFALLDATTPYTSGLIKPGSYSLTETQLSDWDLSALCDNGTDPTTGNVTLTAGQNVTCLYTNTQRGQIIVDKVTDPSGNLTSFDFALSGGPDAISQTFALLDATTPYTSGYIKAGSYTLTETQLSGWILTAACDNGDDPTSGDVTLAVGETITCVFTNTVEPGEIIITKDTVPDDPQDFAFIGSGAIGNFDLDDDADGTLPNSLTFSVTPDTYTVVEGATSGWSLANLVCSDPTSDTSTEPGLGRATITLDPGETVSCVFTNTVNTSLGSITIVKDAVPDNSQSFDFTGDLGAFSLIDNGNPFSSTLTQLNLAIGTYVVTETTVAGWTLSGLNCTDPDGGSSTGATSATIDLDAGENVTCIFTNTFASNSITIIKDTVPDSTQAFSFSGDMGSFSLVDNGNPLSNTLTQLSLLTGTYVVTETPVAGWTLSGIDCGSDANTIINLAGGAASIGLDDGENLICTFTNQATSVSSGTLYLPLIVKNLSYKPDLTITNFEISPASPTSADTVIITVTVQNIGNAATEEGFWVDFYIDPVPVPDETMGERRWHKLGSNVSPKKGIAWPVSTLLAPNESVVLTSHSAPGTIAPSETFSADWLDNPNFVSGTDDLYAFADSFDSSLVPAGEINERDESNNRDMIGSLGVLVTDPQPGQTSPTNRSQPPPRPDMGENN